jgi:gliding motility-associated-like protein
MNYKTKLIWVLCFFFLGLNLISANDDPCNATTISVNTSCTSVTYSNATATNTVGVPDPGCAGYSGGDIWFTFTMPNYGYHTILELSAGTMTDGGMAVYSGTDCSTLTLVSCDDNSGTGNMPTITVDDGCGFEFAGATFWVRVWENGNDNNGTFDICAYTISPNVPSGVAACGSNLIAGNACCDAVLLGDELDGYCGNTGGYTDIPDEIPGFCAFVDNNAWLSFIASETTVDISIVSSNCTFGNGIQVAILETSDCTNFNVVSNCWNPGAPASGNLIANGLTIGETYYILVDGWASDACDYTLGIVSGIETVSVSVDDDEICQGESTQLHADVIGAGVYTYNWSPAASLNDPSSANPIATPSVSTDYTVTITGVVDDVHTVSVTVYPSAPLQPTVIGSTSICENAIGTVYTSSITNTSNYIWTVTGSATIAGGNGMDTILVDWGVSGGSVCLVAENNCGLSPQECITVITTSQPIITATDPAHGCAPNPFDLNTIMVSNSGTGGGLITYYEDLADAINGVNDIFPPTTTNSGTYYIRMETGPDCYDIDSADVVIEDPALVVVNPGDKCSPDFIDLSTVVINEVNGYPGGTKTYYLNATDATNASSPLASTQVFTGGTYWVRYQTPGGCFAIAPIIVNIDITPDITISQPPPLCPGGSIDLDTISFTDANGATFTKYFYNNVIFANLGFNALALSNTVVSMPQTYYLRAETANGCFQIIEISITAGVTPDAAISGSGTFCEGTNTDLIFALNGGPFDVVYTDGTNYFTLNNISNNHTETITVNTDSIFSLVTVLDANGCSGNILGGDVVIIASIAPTAQISGDATFCDSSPVDIDFTFTGNGPFDAEYTDGLDTFNLTGVSFSHTVSHTVTADVTFTLVSVTDVYGCTGTVSGSAIITVYPLLQIVNIVENCDAAFTMYSVSFEIIGGDVVTYNVSGDPGTLSGNTFTSDPIASGTPYSFTVTENSGCPVQIVSGSQDCSCATDAGQMDLNPLEVCEDATATATFLMGSNTLNPGDVFEYVLHDNAGAILGNVIAVSSTPDFSFLLGMAYGATYYISPIAGPDNGSGNVDVNHLCFSIAPGTPVTFYELPEASISGTASICAGTSMDLVFNFSVGVAPFDVVVLDGNTNTNTNINNLVDGDIYTVSPTVTTTYTIISVTDSSPAICTGNGTGSATVTVNQPPQVSNIQFICNNINTQYQVSFELAFGDPASYTVNGNPGTLDNLTNIFTSNFINNGTPYNFLIDDINACGPVAVNGNYVCPCTSNAGEMGLLLLEACEYEKATAQHINTVLNLDGNDVLGFILYDQSSPLPGSVMLTSPTPEFGYDPSLAYGIIYHIAAVVADDSGIGFPVLDDNIDACLSVSNGQPVMFYQNPLISILGSNTICEGDSTDIVFNLIGDGPFNVTYNDETGDQTLSGIDNGHVLRVAPTLTTTYTLVSVDLSIAPFCNGNINPVNNSVTIEVIEMPVVSNIVADCNQLGTSYTIRFEISGGNAALYNVSGDPGTLTGNIFTSDLLVGGSTYNFQVDDGSGCPPVMLTATEYCNCTPDIKPAISLDQDISCNGESNGVLVVTNENGLAPFGFEWNTGTIGEKAEDLGTGWHYVTMTDGNNCTSIDSFYLDEPTPIQAVVKVITPTCFDDNDAVITFENVEGGTGAYSFSIDYSTSFTENSFYNLPAGTYEGTIEDGNGCIWQDMIEIINPEELIINIGEDITVELGDSIAINPYSSLPTNSFLWKPDAFIECADCWNQMIYPTKSIRYTLTATTEDGCEASAQLAIIVTKERPIFIPNIFSPNGDGDNDIFKVYSGRGVEVIKTFRIFDRWGAFVYGAQNLRPGVEDFGWDGRLKGKNMSQGVYVYFLEVIYKDGKSEIIRGDVTLLR